MRDEQSSRILFVGHLLFHHHLLSIGNINAWLQVLAGAACEGALKGVNVMGQGVVVAGGMNGCGVGVEEKRDGAVVVFNDVGEVDGLILS